MEEASGSASLRTRRVTLLRFIAVLVLAVASCALVSAYLLYFSKAAKIARDLPVGATAEDVAARSGSRVYEVKVRGSVLTCYYRFSDQSVLRMAFLIREDTKKYTTLETKTEVTGTSLKRYQDGVIQGPLWDVPTYDYLEVPEYGEVLKPVQKERVEKVWVLGKISVAPFLNWPSNARPTPLPKSPGVRATGGTAKGFVATPAPPAAATQVQKEGSALSADYSRGHVPQPGTKERRALMDAARQRLKTTAAFIVGAIVVSGDFAVADLTPEGDGTRRIVTFEKKAGRWVAIDDSRGSDSSFEAATGITPDSQVTGEF